MASPEHVHMALKSAEAWNAWLGELGDFPDLDLSGTAFPDGTDFSRRSLRYVNFKDCSLKGANFEASYGFGADFTGADLTGANLHEADFREAVFENARFTGASVTDANLSETVLIGADFRQADLSGSFLENADVLRADFRGANLTDAKLMGATCEDPDIVLAPSMDEADEEALEKRYAESGTRFDDAVLVEANFMHFEGYGVNFDRANLESAWLAYAKLLYASTVEANFHKATLIKADLRFGDHEGADFSDAEMDKADLGASNLRGAKFDRAMLEEIEFRGGVLDGASFVDADLSSASLVEVSVQGTNFTGARIYGVAAWDMTGEPASQKDLIISKRTEGAITTDELEVAQFLYLMYNNKKIRNVLNTIQAKSVLILGRFTPPERKAVLDGLREKLREKNLLPIVFDFDRPDDRDYTETVQTLAGMSLFVIADVTSPKSTPLELEATAKQFKIPILPIIDVTVDERPFAMLQDLQNNLDWVLKTRGYRGKEDLMVNVDKLIKLAMDKHVELRSRKAVMQEVLTFDDL